jgi:hypothetical protein
MKRLIGMVVMAGFSMGLSGSVPDSMSLIVKPSYVTPLSQFAAPNNTSLVLRDEDGFHVAPLFAAIQPDLLHLIKRSYMLTKREGNGNFRNEHRMLFGDSEFSIPETGHRWICDRNFTGIHGNLSGSSRIGRVLNVAFEAVTLGKFSPEIDFPGYVAILKIGPYHVIAIVLRGSQGEDFQPGSGLLSASWATNYDAGPLEVNPELYGFYGRIHGGYLTKINSCNLPREEFEQMVAEGEISNPLRSRADLDFVYPLFESVHHAIEQIPEDERGNIRFVVTGHSQGGGLAQIALPLIINQFGGAIPGFDNNIETPRFFGYFLSAPRVAADQETVDRYNALVGHDNMINHFAFRDVVTMACLHGYRILGHLACDSAWDVLYRGICSEAAYNNRMLLLDFVKASIDADAFDISDDHRYWVLNGNSGLIICWDEIRHLLSHQQFTCEQINPEGIVNLCNLALDQYRQRHNIDEESHFTIDQVSFAEDCDWGEIQRICRGDLFPYEIQLNDETCAMLDRIVNNIYGNTVVFSSSGCFNVVALIDTALDLLDAGRGKENPGGCWECLKRLCWWRCCCDHSGVESTFDFDPEFQALLKSKGIDPAEHGMIKLGGSLLIAYLHFGSGANGFNVKLFDKFLPSRNLEFALENGEIVATEQYPMLYSEIKELGASLTRDESYEKHSDDEIQRYRPPSVIFKMQRSTSTHLEDPVMRSSKYRRTMHT